MLKETQNKTRLERVFFVEKNFLFKRTVYSVLNPNIQ